MADRKQTANARLQTAILEHLPEAGIWAAPGGAVFLARRNHAGITEHRFDRPLASLLVQGTKRTIIGTREYELSPNRLLTVAIDMPSSSMLLDATPRHPLLTVFFHINPRTLSELLLELGAKPAHRLRPANGVCVADADEDVLEVLARLVTAAAGPAPDAIHTRLLLRELHYLLLRGPQRQLLSSLYGSALPGKQLFPVIAYLRGHLDGPVRLAELAEGACMSESTLYRHFKALTGFSPLQYHKQLRLHEARRLMLAENERAANAAFRVGFESVPQFSREYKRLFGQPPRRDTKARQ